MKRRTFLHVLGGSAAALALRKPLWAAANSPAASDDFFIFIHAAGGWDVTLWADPRNERKGLVEPASSENTDTAWRSLTSRHSFANRATRPGGASRAG